MSTRRDEPACASPACGCSPGSPQDAEPNRREFVRLVGLGAAAAVAATGLPVSAGPFEDENEYLAVIPRDKRLDPKWVASLSARGEKTIYRDRQALRHVGMPVGGLFAGTVYLGGDGRLWLWDVFNDDQEGIAPRTVKYLGRDVPTRDGANVVAPAEPSSPFAQGFALRIGDTVRRLTADDWTHVAFDGRYPIGRVTYADPKCPIEVTLEAFSPFCPMELDHSSLPVVVLNYTLTNESERPVTCELRGWLENAVALGARETHEGRRVNNAGRASGVRMVVASAEEVRPAARSPRPDIVFADFEAESYGRWTVDGTAFGAGPVEASRVPGYQGNLGGEGRRVVNSHASAPGGSVGEKDGAVGTLTSPPFAIERDWVQFLIGGGNHPGKTCLNLLIDGRVVLSATGRNANTMAPGAFRVTRWAGQTARLQVVDQARGGWGNVGVDRIVFTDRPPGVSNLAERPDFGTMALAALSPGSVVSAECDASGGFDRDQPRPFASAPLAGVLIGGASHSVTIPPGGTSSATFLLAWHFPNFRARGLGGAKVGHHYARRFASAAAVAEHVARNLDHLQRLTREWVVAWYDSTLPYWLLDRTMANTSTLATTTCHRLADGRFWAWEGVGCCEGTCTHVWHYAQAPARLFPDLERDQRRRVDFGLAQHPDGGIGMRAGLNGANEPAHDGQCGRILGAYREHQMSVDDTFLRDVWPGIKKAVEYMMARDGDGDGIVEGPQPNTLDAAWYGKISALASLYLAALRAGAAMAEEVGDAAFAARCRALAERGARSILTLFNGEYFIQREDPAHAHEVGVGNGCYIDQVFGQTWAHWVGLGTLFDRGKQLDALRALWAYNFVPDVGPFRQRFERGRWYATAGDGGLLMATWPKGGQNPHAKDHWQSMYFNECMTGFEWQAAAHMVFEGRDQPDLLEHGLAVARAIHDRYDARRRNPYNEVECSDHYSRAMASYGLFLAVCGYEHHGPKRHLGFAPRLSPDDFRAAFTAAGAWGGYSQTRASGTLRANIRVARGTLRLKTLAVVPQSPARASRVSAEIDRGFDAATPVNAATVALDRGPDGSSRVLVTFGQDVAISPRETLRVVISEA